MNKIYDEPHDGMDMPCRCDCGNWFDLNDGYSSNHSSVVICQRCHDVEEIEDEIDEVQRDMDNGYIGKRDGNRQIKKLKTKLEKYEHGANDD